MADYVTLASEPEPGTENTFGCAASQYSQTFYLMVKVKAEEASSVTFSFSSLCRAEAYAEKSEFLPPVLVCLSLVLLLF